MKNITVSVNDEVYHRARIRAAELKTSVSAIVREKLIEMASEETEKERLERLEKETLDRVRERGGTYSASTRLNRDELHDRDALR